MNDSQIQHDSTQSQSTNDISKRLLARIVDSGRTSQSVEPTPVGIGVKAMRAEPASLAHNARHSSAALGSQESNDVVAASAEKTGGQDPTSVPPSAHAYDYSSLGSSRPQSFDAKKLLATMQRSLTGARIAQLSQKQHGIAGRDNSDNHRSPFQNESLTNFAAASSYRLMDLKSIRADFPIFRQTIHGHPLIWFDNAATTQKPQQVIDALAHFYSSDYSNIHRGAHTLAARATDRYESARDTVAQFINARSSKDIVFVRGATEGINFVANTCGALLQDGDEILVTEMEHHANIVPWQMLAEKRGLRLRVIPFDDRGDILLSEYRRLLSRRSRIVSFTHASNTLGTVLPVEEMAAMARHVGARVVVDGAQSIAHMPIDVQAMNCDFFIFSGHKVFAPTGIGAVYIRPELHDVLPPWQGGGNMIHRVSFDDTTYAAAPARFEAGTPSIGDAVGLEAALRYLRQWNPAELWRHEHSLLEHATHQLEQISGVTIIGRATNKMGVISFVLDGYSTETVGRELNRYGIAVRTGHHCAQPSLRHFRLDSTVRPSFAIYNTHEEVDEMISVIRGMAKRA